MQHPADTAGTDIGRQIYRYKIAPPTYNGNYAQWEEWSQRFKAHLCLQHRDYAKFIQAAEDATVVLTDMDLELSASTDDKKDRWLQMAKD